MCPRWGRARAVGDAPSSAKPATSRQASPDVRAPSPLRNASGRRFVRDAASFSLPRSITSLSRHVRISYDAPAREASWARALRRLCGRGAPQSRHPADLMAEVHTPAHRQRGRIPCVGPAATPVFLAFDLVFSFDFVHVGDFLTSGGPHRRFTGAFRLQPVFSTLAAHLRSSSARSPGLCTASLVRECLRSFLLRAGFRVVSTTGRTA